MLCYFKNYLILTIQEVPNISTTIVCLGFSLTYVDPGIYLTSALYSTAFTPFATGNTPAVECIFAPADSIIVHLVPKKHFFFKIF